MRKGCCARLPRRASARMARRAVAAETAAVHSCGLSLCFMRGCALCLCCLMLVRALRCCVGAFWVTKPRASWRSRRQHQVASSQTSGRLFVIGGQLTDAAGVAEDAEANDVWTSDDGAVTWQLRTAHASLWRRGGDAVWVPPRAGGHPVHGDVLLCLGARTAPAAPAWRGTDSCVRMDGGTFAVTVQSRDLSAAYGADFSAVTGAALLLLEPRSYAGAADEWTTLLFSSTASAASFVYASVDFGATWRRLLGAPTVSRACCTCCAPLSRRICMRTAQCGLLTCFASHLLF